MIDALNRTLACVLPIRRGLGLERALAPHVLGLWLLSREDCAIRRMACDLIEVTLTHGGETPRYGVPTLTDRALEDWRDDMIDHRMREDRDTEGSDLYGLPSCLGDMPRDILESLEAESREAFFTLNVDGLSRFERAMYAVLEEAVGKMNSNQLAYAIKTRICTRTRGVYVRERIKHINDRMGWTVIASTQGSNDSGYWLAHRSLPSQHT